MIRTHSWDKDAFLGLGRIPDIASLKIVDTREWRPKSAVRRINTMFSVTSYKMALSVFTAPNSIRYTLNREYNGNGPIKI